MTDEFKDAALIELKKSFPFADDFNLLEMARILWELIPKIYGKKDE